VLSVCGLTKVYDGRAVVNEVTFALRPGTVTAFLGPNGSGKSTTLRMICGLTAPTAGQAWIAGRRYVDWPNPGHVVGALLHWHDLHPGRTGRGQLRFAARLAGLPGRRVDEVLEIVGLRPHADRKIGTYDLALRQRTALAQALLGDPPLLLLDEPIDGLGPDGVLAVRTLLRTHAGRGGTALVSGHLLSEVDQLADRVIVLHEGTVVGDGPASGA
jgi:ABC-2 type transport system ATP-binding protein